MTKLVLLLALAATGASAQVAPPPPSPRPTPRVHVQLEHDVRLDLELGRLADLDFPGDLDHLAQLADVEWAQDDPADSLYRLAGEALNRGDYRRAATLFQELARRYPQSAYAADAAYWEAFARYRLDTEPELRSALRLLEAQLAARGGQSASIRDGAQLARTARAGTTSDAAALANRVRGVLAARGDMAMRRRLGEEARRQGDGCDREEVAVRVEALNALARIDSGAIIPIVRRVLANQAPCAAGLRERAVLLLGREQTGEAAELLVGVARSDASPDVQRSAVSWLGRMPGEPAVVALEQVLSSAADDRLRAAAMGALASHESPRARQALRGYVERGEVPLRLRMAGVDGLARDTSAANAVYLRTLYGRVDSLRLKERVINAVARMPDAESGQWLTALARNANEPMRLRRDALAALTRHNMPVAELARLYDATPERDLRETLVSAFGRRKEPEATDKLLAIARGDNDPRLRRAAIGALSRKNDPRTVKLLLEIIDP